VKFGVIGEGASSLDDIAISTRNRHVHRVDVDFGKERSWSGNSRGNEEISRLSNLAEVACMNVPCYVGFHVQPPESEGNK
jgi:hypothetical protein